jgi:hypothetical protein
MQPGEQFVLGVGLPYLDVQTEFPAGALAELDQPGVAGQPIDVDLTGAEAAEVGAVEDVHLHRATASS